MSVQWSLAPGWGLVNGGIRKATHMLVWSHSFDQFQQIKWDRALCSPAMPSLWPQPDIHPGQAVP